MNLGMVGAQGFPAPAVPILRGYLAGMTLSNATASSQALSISAGVAVDSTATVAMSTSGSFVKTLALAWVPGAGSIGAPAGAMGIGLSVTTTTTYHVMSISTPTGPDFYADTSATAANAPPGTLAFRRIGSVRTDAATNVIQFVQDGDYFEWTTLPAVDVNSGNPGTTAQTTAMTVTLGINVIAQTIWDVNNAAAGGAPFLLVSDLATTDSAPSPAAGAQISNVSNDTRSTEILVRTNTSGQVRWRLSYSDANVGVNSRVRGWFDTRGRFS